MNDSSETRWILEQAAVLGFDLCGVVRAEKFSELDLTKQWLMNGYAGEMSYLADPRRLDPLSIMPGLRSVIVCALNYNSSAPQSVEALPLEQTDPRGWISRYAWGQDYHDVFQQKLQQLAARLQERFMQPFETRVYADTGPLNERVFAKRAGLGWLGKNTLLLNSKLGSWFFLGIILTTLDIPPTLAPPELPPPDLCGSCTKCIDACPTGALVEPYLMDSRLCISYLTIELRGSIPENLRESMGRHVFGCDICQDVCPWNRRAPVTQAPEFQPRILTGRDSWLRRA
jgi:epoxyqueuosine reductase